MARREIVLIVEDEPLLRMLSAESIEANGYDVVEANHAEEAILILEAQPDIDIVFTGHKLPGSMDGLRLAHYVRDRWPPVRIITIGAIAPCRGDAGVEQSVPAKALPSVRLDSGFAQARVGGLTIMSNHSYF